MVELYLPFFLNSEDRCVTTNNWSITLFEKLVVDKFVKKGITSIHIKQRIYTFHNDTIRYVKKRIQSNNCNGFKIIIDMLKNNGYNLIDIDLRYWFKINGKV